VDTFGRNGAGGAFVTADVVLRAGESACGRDLFCEVDVEGADIGGVGVNVLGVFAVPRTCGGIFIVSSAETSRTTAWFCGFLVSMLGLGAVGGVDAAFACVLKERPQRGQKAACGISGVWHLGHSLVGVGVDDGCAAGATGASLVVGDARSVFSFATCSFAACTAS